MCVCCVVLGIRCNRTGEVASEVTGREREGAASKLHLPESTGAERKARAKVTAVWASWDAPALGLSSGVAQKARENLKEPSPWQQGSPNQSGRLRGRRSQGIWLKRAI